MKREDENTSQYASLRATQTITKLRQTVVPSTIQSESGPVTLPSSCSTEECHSPTKFMDDNDITAELRTWLQTTPENSYQEAIQALVSKRCEVTEKDEHYAENQPL